MQILNSNDLRQRKVGHTDCWDILPQFSNRMKQPLGEHKVVTLRPVFKRKGI